MTKLGSTFRQIREMSGPTEKKEIKITWEEGGATLAVAFDLEDEGGDLNFSLLTRAFKNSMYFISNVV